MDRKKRTSIPMLSKIRAELQKEIDSLCPFCSSSDVGHFEIHHIDEDPSNSNFSNLILICPTCHSKITKREITMQMVETVKQSLPVQGNIEFSSVTIDETCSWERAKNTPFAFFVRESDKSPFPLFNLSFINHYKRTILLNGVHLRIKHFESGLSGIPFPILLKPSALYRIPISNVEEGETYLFEDQLQIPAEQAFKFQIQLFEQYQDEMLQIEGRNLFFFTFLFNNNVSVKIPTVFLNCERDEPMTIRTLS